MKRKFVSFVVFFLIAGILVVSAQTEKKYVLKFNHVLTTQDPYHEAFLKWAEAVSARTNGNLKIEVFPSAQLGVEEDILEQIRQGSNVGQNTDAARLGQYVPAIAVMNGTYFVDSLEVGWDPVHFGILFCTIITAGNMTPPVGLAMSAVCTVLDVPISEYIREMWPWVFATVLAVSVLIFFPNLVLAIPRLLF
jgi:hypothetical protein